MSEDKKYPLLFNPTAPSRHRGRSTSIESDATRSAFRAACRQSAQSNPSDVSDVNSHAAERKPNVNLNVRAHEYFLGSFPRRRVRRRDGRRDGRRRRLRYGTRADSIPIGIASRRRGSLRDDYPPDGCRSRVCFVRCIGNLRVLCLTPTHARARGLKKKGGELLVFCTSMVKQ